MDKNVKCFTLRNLSNGPRDSSSRYFLISRRLTDGLTLDKVNEKHERSLIKQVKLDRCLNRLSSVDKSDAELQCLIQPSPTGDTSHNCGVRVYFKTEIEMGDYPDYELNLNYGGKVEGPMSIHPTIQPTNHCEDRWYKKQK